MDTVRARFWAESGVSNRVSCRYGIHDPLPGRVVLLQMELSVLDIVYVLGVIAVFALVGVIGWGVEKL
jgi:hypothetical protein